MRHLESLPNSDENNETADQLVNALVELFFTKNLVKSQYGPMIIAKFCDVVSNRYKTMIMADDQFLKEQVSEHNQLEKAYYSHMPMPQPAVPKMEPELQPLTRSR